MLSHNKQQQRNPTPWKQLLESKIFFSLNKLKQQASKKRYQLKNLEEGFPWNARIKKVGHFFDITSRMTILILFIKKTNHLAIEKKKYNSIYYWQFLRIICTNTHIHIQSRTSTHSRTHTILDNLQTNNEF